MENLALSIIAAVIVLYVQYLIIKGAVLSALKEFDHYKEVKQKKIELSKSETQN